VKADYTSVALFYANTPQFEDSPILIDDLVEKVPHHDKLTAQGMVYSLYWLAKASYDDPAIVFSMGKSDKWFVQIDPEAVPMAQIYLNGLDRGRYKLHVEYGKSEKPGPFSIWQGSAQVSEWIEPDKDMAADTGKTVYAGEIEITDELNTITLRKKADDTSVRILSFLFEKIN
jgi:hypothetical protein